MMKVIGGFFLMIVCALLGAYIAVMGAALAGLPSSDWSLLPLLFMALGFVVGGLGFLVLISVKSRRCSSCSLEARVIVSVLGALFLAFLSGVVGYRISKYDHETNLKRSMARSAELDRRNHELCSILRSDPEIAIREQWYKAADERRVIYQASLYHRDVNYPSPMLTQLYALDLDETSKRNLLANPSIDQDLLESEFHRVFKGLNRMGADYAKMHAILRNPNAKSEWFEEVAASGALEKDVTYGLRSIIEKRRKQDRTAPR